MTTTATQKIQLTDDERALARRSTDKAVFVAVVEFTGPRGRKYRPIRTDAKVTEGAVLALGPGHPQQALRQQRHAGPHDAVPVRRARQRAGR